MEQNYTLRAVLTLATGYIYQLTPADICAYSLEEGVQGGGLLLGAAPAAHARLTLLNPGGAWQRGGSRLGNRTLSGADVRVELGENGVFRPAGRFTVSRVEADEGESVLTLSGYDGMLHALNAAFEDTLEYPQTLGAILAHIMSQSGLTLSGSPACNAAVAIAQKPDWGSGCTLRRALGWAAGAMGCFVRFDRAGSLVLLPAWPQGNAASLPVSEALGLTVSPDAFILNRVRIHPRSGLESAACAEAALDPALPAGASNTLEVRDNALFRPGAPELQTLADGLLSALSGMTLTPFSGEFCCDPARTAGERAAVGDLRNGAHASMILAARLRVENGVALSLACEADVSGLRLPAALSGSGLLSGSSLGDGTVTARCLAAGCVDTEKLSARCITADKLAAGAVTAEKLAAGAVSADAITAGKLSTDRLIVGGTEFSIVKAINDLAGQAASDYAHLHGAVVDDGTITANKVAAGFGGALDISANAAILLLAGKLDGTNSHMELTRNAISMVGGEINIATDDMEIRGMANGEELLSLTPADGLRAPLVVTEEIRARNAVTVLSGDTVPWKGSIQASLDACPKYLSQPAVLTIPDGTYTEDVDISGFVGELTVLAFSDVVIRGSVRIRNCTNVTLTGGLSAANSALSIYPLLNATPLTVKACGSALIRGVKISGYRGRLTASDGSIYALVVSGGHAVAANCIMEYAKRAIHCTNASTVYVSGCAGGQSGADPTTNANLEYGVDAATGAHVTVAGTIPLGGTLDQYASNATITGTGTGTAGGIDYTPPTQYTDSFRPAHQCQYVFNESRNDGGTVLSQGRYGREAGTGATGWRLGALWFDLGTLTGKTIVSASLRLYRGGIGYAEAVPIGMCAFKTTWAGHTDSFNPIERRQGQFTAATVPRETEFTADVTALLPDVIANGWALAIYDPVAAYNPDQLWSDNYANIGGVGNAYEPLLTVTYR